MEQAQSGKLISSAPRNDASVVARHVLVVIIIGTFRDLLFKKPFVCQGRLLDDGDVQNRA
jgi:hypothetical protein